MSTTQIHRRDLDDGTGLLVAGYDDEESALARVHRQLRQSTGTPAPGQTTGGREGPAGRATNRATAFSIRLLRSLGQTSHELQDAVRTRRDELYRNEFPVLQPRFTAKCEVCGTEFDAAPDECPDCGHEELRRPDPGEKRAAREQLESVNREGQSLRDLMRYCEPDQWFAGCSVIVVQYDYTIARDSALYDDGEILSKEVDELVYGDPDTIEPVVNEHRRAGGVWWTCPVHRSEPDDEPGRCEECGAERREVFFVEETNRDESAYYFRDEVISWAFPFPKLHGLDGIAPAAAVAVRQVILDMMDRYGAAFYDPEADRLPNQLMVLHTSNPEHWQAELERIRDEDDPYDSPILSNEVSPRGNDSAAELQVIDAMPDELLGQNAEIKQTYKEDIRQAIGVSNVHDSDLSDAGGLNAEGLQVEITDRSIAAQQQAYRQGVLDRIGKVLGLEDWRIGFVPAHRDADATTLKERVRAGALAAQAGLEVSWENDDVTIHDGAFDAPSDGEGPKARLGDMLPGDGEDADDDPVPEPEDAPAVDRQTADLLSDAYCHIVWPDTDEQQAATQAGREPFWGQDGDVPANVQRHITAAVAQTDFSVAEDASTSQLQPYFREKLIQPQGWSLESLTDGLVEEFDFERDYARTVARSGSASVLNRAKVQAFAELEAGAGEPVLYFWRGPDTESTTEACRELKERTNPDYGGTPRPLAEFQQLLREIADEHFPDLETRDFQLHPNERHTVEAMLASELE